MFNNRMFLHELLMKLDANLHETLVKLDLFKHRLIEKIDLAVYPYEYAEAVDLAIETPFMSEDIIDVLDIPEQQKVSFIRKDRRTGIWEGWLQCSMKTEEKTEVKEKEGKKEKDDRIDIPFLVVTMGYDWIPLPDDLQYALNQPTLAIA